MDAQGNNEPPKMGNFVYDAPKRYSISGSPPDSLRGDPETPRTPDEAVFGEPVASSGAQGSSSSAAGATAVLSTFTHFPVGSLSPVNEVGPAASGSSQARGREALGREALGREALGHEIPGREIPGREIPGREIPGREIPGRGTPRFIGSFSGFGNQSSQIWAPTRLDQGTAAAAASPPDSQAAAAAAAPRARWGSLDAHMSQRDSFVRRDAPLPRPSPFAAYQTRFPAAVNTPPNVFRPANSQGFTRQPSSYSVFSQQHSGPRYNHDAGVTAMNRQMSAASNMADSSFDLSELHSSLFSSAGAEAAVNQPLGIDILRLSVPGAAPIRQLPSAARPAGPAGPVGPAIPARPATRPAQVPANAPTGGFLPMQAVMQQTPSRAFTADMSPYAPSTAAFSSRYHGMHTETNASADHLAPEENCALWLTNLPEKTSINQLLTSIRNVGRIWCTYINYPDFNAHTTAAAKVVFFTPEAAQQLLSISWTRGLFVENHRVRVSHNRIKYGSHAVAGRISRVLIITGLAEFVNEASLTKFFKDRFIFQLDEVTQLIRAGGRAVMEFKFGSYRCQSQMGKMSLEKDRPYGLKKVEFGDDPCEVGDTMSSYGIAAERIQGRGL